MFYFPSSLSNVLKIIVSNLLCYNKRTKMTPHQSSTNSTRTIPTIQIIEEPYVNPRSQSFEIPREKQQGVHARFDTSASSVRPGMGRAGISHNEGQVLRRPSLQHSHRSFARSVSSFSLYSNFAGERFNQTGHKHCAASIEKRRKSNSKSLSVEQREIPQEKRRVGSSNDIEYGYSSNSSIDDEEDDGTPKASVGKAMFMFLKAFIGSGVLFLPKA
jgi:hypothetical protein